MPHGSELGISQVLRLNDGSEITDSEQIDVFLDGVRQESARDFKVELVGIRLSPDMLQPIPVPVLGELEESYEWRPDKSNIPVIRRADVEMDLGTEGPGELQAAKGASWFRLQGMNETLLIKVYTPVVLGARGLEASVVEKQLVIERIDAMRQE